MVCVYIDSIPAHLILPMVLLYSVVYVYSVRKKRSTKSQALLHVVPIWKHSFHVCMESSSLGFCCDDRSPDGTDVGVGRFLVFPVGGAWFSLRRVCDLLPMHVGLILVSPADWGQEMVNVVSSSSM
jgi:hypothetical protein